MGPRGPGGAAALGAGGIQWGKASGSHLLLPRSAHKTAITPAKCDWGQLSWLAAGQEPGLVPAAPRLQKVCNKMLGFRAAAATEHARTPKTTPKATAVLRVRATGELLWVRGAWKGTPGLWCQRQLLHTQHLARNRFPSIFQMY